jgi:transcriptional regulator with XRE-family HTH domain
MLNFDYLKDIRRRNKVSIKEMALRIGVSEVSLSMYENGRRDISAKLLEKYADELGYEFILTVKRK